MSEAEPDLRGVQRGPSQGGLGMAWGANVDTARVESVLEEPVSAVEAEPVAVYFVPALSLDAAYIDRQRAWSEATFGPGLRTEGILQHLEKEHDEVRADPTDLGEWVDLMILALDGAWRAGHEPKEILEALYAKQERNLAREWPDWREFDQGQAIEHVRATEA